MNEKQVGEKLGVFDAAAKRSREDDLVSVVLDALHSCIGGVVISQMDGTIKWVNPAFLKMSGYGDEASLVGRRLTDLFASEAIRSMKDLSDAIGESNGDRAEMQMLDEDGEHFFVEVSGKDVRSAGGDVIGQAFSMIDITLRKRIEEALKASKKNLQSMSARLVDAQEVERSRVARELHDSIGASLSALKFSVEGWFEQQKGSGDQCASPEEIVSSIQQIIEEVRRISQNLHPSILDDLGLGTAIRSFCRQHQENHPELRIEADLAVDENAISKRLQLVIYRMVQECTTNALRHGNADTMKIRLSSEEKDSVVLEMQDNGSGFDVERTWDRLTPDSGIGLTSMHERAELTGGRLTIESKNGQGTLVRCRWPSG